MCEYSQPFLTKSRANLKPKSIMLWPSPRGRKIVQLKITPTRSRQLGTFVDLVVVRKLEIALEHVGPAHRDSFQHPNEQFKDGSRLSTARERDLSFEWTRNREQFRLSVCPSAYRWYAFDLRKGTIFKIVGTSLILILGLRTTMNYVQWTKVQREFDSVQVGQSRLTVLGKLGKPNWGAGRCDELFAAPPGCAIQYVYGHPFSPLDPDYYVVSFSAEDRVIQAGRSSSP
jgi:hypothetical protein